MSDWPYPFPEQRCPDCGHQHPGQPCDEPTLLDECPSEDGVDGGGHGTIYAAAPEVLVTPQGPDHHGTRIGK